MEADEKIFFFFNEACSSNENQQDLLDVSSHYGACHLTHSFITESGVVKRHLKPMGQTSDIYQLFLF